MIAVVCVVAYVSASNLGVSYDHRSRREINQSIILVAGTSDTVRHDSERIEPRKNNREEKKKREKKNADLLWAKTAHY